MEPKLDRPRFHLWAEADPEAVTVPRYLGVMVITNADQLTAETQARGLGIRPKDSPFHLTALWVWAAGVRAGLVEVKFREFTTTYAWSPAEDQAPEAEAEGVEEEDPTFGPVAVNTG